MYYCLDCKQTFHKPNIIEENHGFKDGLTEKFSVCPNCGSSNYGKEIKCDECWGYIDGDYIQLKNGNNYCENCFNSKNIFGE